MGEAIVNLTEERATTVDKLRRVQELEHQLEEAERCLAMERVAMDDFPVEVADKGK